MIVQADARHIPIADASVQCVVTSPPYWGLRDYGVSAQLGLERTPEEYVANMVAVFQEVKRVLRDDGTCWVNMGDSYASDIKGSGGVPEGSIMFNRPNSAQKSQKFSPRKVDHGLKPKDLVGIPWRLAFALQADGWYLRSDIIWAKPNPMPESVTDRPTKSHEYIFLLTKSARYYFDQEAVKEQANPEYESRYGYKFNVGDKESNGGGRPDGASNTPGMKEYTGTRNIRSVWSIPTAPYPEAHFATFPPEIPKRCILAGTSARGCCVVCGAPWERVVDTTYSNWADGNNNGRRKGDIPEERMTFASGKRCEKSTTTIGWRPTCTCNAPNVPCVCLDPFAGSGTTVMVAESLGRRGVGLELKPEYIALAKKRCQVTLGLPL